MGFVSRTRRKIRDKIYHDLLGHEPPRTGHIYRSEVTGEKFTIQTIANQLLIKRMDAKQDDLHKMTRSTFDGSISRGYIVHDESCKCDYV